MKKWALDYIKNNILILFMQDNLYGKYEFSEKIYKKIKNTDEWWDWLIIQHFKYSGSDDSMRHSSVAFCGEEENRKALIDSHWYDVLDYGIRPDGKFWIEVLDRELRNMGIILYCSIVVDSETGELWWYLRNSRFDFKN